MSESRINLGKTGEELAVQYLQQHGLSILARNYRQKSGEIDIIAEDRDCLVFVEVKTRKSLLFGHPYEAVTSRKQAQLTRVALDYMTRHDLRDHKARFDVVSIVLPDHGTPNIEHLANCFEPQSDL